MRHMPVLYYNTADFAPNSAERGLGPQALLCTICGDLERVELNSSSVGVRQVPCFLSFTLKDAIDKELQQSNKNVNVCLLEHWIYLL